MDFKAYNRNNYSTTTEENTDVKAEFNTQMTSYVKVLKYDLQPRDLFKKLFYLKLRIDYTERDMNM